MSRFILPPHPANKCHRKELNHFEKQKLWCAQRKFNGTHVVINISVNGIWLWNRHGKVLSTYKLTPFMHRCLLTLDTKDELVLAGELLHTKAKSKITNQQSLTDTIVLFDILYCGKYLSCISQRERLQLLWDICQQPQIKESRDRGLIVAEDNNSKLWLAEVFTEDFLYHFDEFWDEDKSGNDFYPEIEGLILRLNSSRFVVKDNPDVNWLVRCRKPKPNMYLF